MKSAYELAMERLEKSAPTVAISDEQKNEIAEVDIIYKAKIAERELFLNEQIQKKQSSSPMEALELEHQLNTDLRRLREECESKKDAIRNRKA